MNNFSLISQSWCDLVFEGRNRNYGAYVLRLGSDGRHLKAMLITGVFCVACSLWAVSLTRSSVLNVDSLLNNTPVELTNWKEETPVVKQVEVEVTPEVAYKNTIKFLAPVIVPDNTMKPEDEMPDQATLTNSNAGISSVTVENGTEGGIDKGTEPHPAAGIVEEPVNEPVFAVEEMPQYPGGTKELIGFLSKNMEYPQSAVEQFLQGVVVVRFVVGRDGRISQAEVIRSLDASCDREALRVVKKMPTWIPGRQNGVAVPVYFTLPVRFALKN